MISKSACPQMLRQTLLAVQKNKAGLRRIRFAGHMRLSARRVEWSSAGLCRYCLDREGGRPVDQSDQYSNLSENTSHSTSGRHRHAHTQRQMWVTDIFEPVCIGQLPFYVYGVFESAAITTHTKHTHAHTRAVSIQLAAKFFLRV